MRRILVVILAAVSTVFSSSIGHKDCSVLHLFCVQNDEIRVGTETQPVLVIWDVVKDEEGVFPVSKPNDSKVFRILPFSISGLSILKNGSVVYVSQDSLSVGIVNRSRLSDPDSVRVITANELCLSAPETSSGFKYIRKIKPRDSSVLVNCGEVGVYECRLDTAETCVKWDIRNLPARIIDISYYNKIVRAGASLGVEKSDKESMCKVLIGVLREFDELNAVLDESLEADLAAELHRCLVANGIFIK